VPEIGFQGRGLEARNNDRAYGTLHELRPAQGIWLEKKGGRSGGKKARGIELQGG